MISIFVPSGFQFERSYVVECVFSKFLLLDFRIIPHSHKYWKITNNSDQGEILIVDSLFLDSSETNWLKLSSLPTRPLVKVNIKKSFRDILLDLDELPLIYSQLTPNEETLNFNGDKVELGIDIFGSIFFMLTRYEEYIKSERDQFDRFPATASLAYQEGFLHRPIVNEYVEILWACMQKLWPRMQRKPRQSRIFVSHDVDHPYQYAFTNVCTLTKNLAGDLFKRHNPQQAISRISSWRQIKRGDLAVDPFNSFDWLMDISEKNNLISAFYFICGQTDPQKDGNHDIRHPLMRQLLRKIYTRGHEIGVHPSFNSYLSQSQTYQEFSNLIKVCSEEGIKQESWGGRQHYLRWRNPETWRNWEQARLTYDSTLTFPEMPGFRCGTCYEFPVYDLINRKQLNLIERPLIVMEQSVLHDQYLGLGHDLQKAFDEILVLKDMCRRYRGDFTLLWHNSNLSSPEYRDLYKQVVTH